VRKDPRLSAASSAPPGAAENRAGVNGPLELVSVSDTGRRRPHNEDSTAIDPDIGLAIVADGMGGYKAGELASAIAVVTIWTELNAEVRRVRVGEMEESSGNTRLAGLLRDAIGKANAQIFETQQREHECHGMGTTVACLLVREDHLVIAHVGDSRVYRLRGDTLARVTSDHSLIQELIDRGFYTPEEAAENTPKNLVTRALGIESSVDVTLREEQSVEGDVYLLCSDGLNDMVTDEDIRLTLCKFGDNLLAAAQDLVRLANAGGGKDNVSVVLGRVRKPGTRKAWLNGWLGR
jgi:PPM family protein phosphatase